MVVAAEELVLVEGTTDILCPRLSCESGCQSCLELSGITPSAGVDDVSGVEVEDVLVGDISVK